MHRHRKHRAEHVPEERYDVSGRLVKNEAAAKGKIWDLGEIVSRVNRSLVSGISSDSCRIDPRSRTQGKGNLRGKTVSQGGSAANTLQRRGGRVALEPRDR